MTAFLSGNRPSPVCPSGAPGRFTSHPTPTRWHGPRQFICTLQGPSLSWGMRDSCASTKAIRFPRSRKHSGRLSAAGTGKTETILKHPALPVKGSSFDRWRCFFMSSLLHRRPKRENYRKTGKNFSKRKKPIKRDTSIDKRVIFSKLTCKSIFTRNRSQTYSIWRQGVIFCCHGTLKTEYPAAEGDTILP